MIGVKVKGKYRKPPLTIDQRALRKVIRPIAVETRNAIRSDVPRLTGALRLALGIKIISRRGNAAAVIGVRSQYTRTTKGKTKLPNLYGLKMEKRYHFLEKHINATLVARLAAAARAMVNELIKSK